MSRDVRNVKALAMGGMVAVTLLAVRPGAAHADCAEVKQVVSRLEQERPLTAEYPLPIGWHARDLALTGDEVLDGFDSCRLEDDRLSDNKSIRSQVTTDYVCVIREMPEEPEDAEIMMADATAFDAKVTSVMTWLAPCLQTDMAYEMDDRSTSVNMRFIKPRPEGSGLGYFDVPQVHITMGQEGSVRDFNHPKAGFNMPRPMRVVRMTISSPAWYLKPEQN
ncbi:hypothetical protein [Hyphomonas pacifica]|uniref:Uncharacterized protein n=1 Tax=Hyphomonas pacifica TaxID=1280941 RepID=A0A062U4Y5_9PROT|nr:hypothetical protein [Hyphomonas pacifica]KCZ51175.1 hypothetical protein HY2_12080 [Hyphomonas pacifica]RAN33654.1 hypothetical protein HY3_12180 [Hyphomonas pacifica]RAN35575.1 hypothetical protein HY11_13790 [Hyphomonas pacifica]